MDGKKILEVVNIYRKFFIKNNIRCSTFPHPRRPKTNEDILCHCYGMLIDIEKFARAGRIGKAKRWLGFVQGCLWSVGAYSIYDLKEHNRPKRGFWHKIKLVIEGIKK